MTTMKAVVIHAKGGPEALSIENRPVPTAGDGQVLIRVKAFGLNRSELMTRQGHSPSVTFPRVLGIEAVGLVEQAPGSALRRGDIVATAMGGMGRDFDGGYAEYVTVPATQVQALRTTLSWEVLGALPEMMQTAWGSLITALRLAAGDHLLIRGGTTSVGLAAAALAKRHGAHVTATTRSVAREPLLRRNGADAVLIDDGSLAKPARAARPDGFDKVLELIGTKTLEDSLRCAAKGGMVCMTGVVGQSWTLDQFSPMEAIPTAVSLTTYGGSAADFIRTPLQEIVDQVTAGALHIEVGRVFRLEEIVEAHRCMEENKANGKIVVLT